MSSEAAGNIPYLVVSEDLKERLKGYLDNDNQIRRTWREFAKSVGGKASVTDGYSCVGVVYAGPEVPDGWRPMRKSAPFGAHAPRSKTQSYKEMNKLPTLVANRNLYAKIIGSNGFIDCRDNALYSVHVGIARFRIEEEDRIILLAPIPSSFKGKLEETEQYKNFPFSDVKEIPWSEYFKMKEMAGAA